MHYDCNRQSKSKLEDEKNKTKHILNVSLASLSDEKKQRQGNREHILLWLYILNDFLLLSHPPLFVLLCFILWKYI